MRLTTTSCLSIGLLVDWLASGYQRDLIEGVSRVASRRAANLLVFVGGWFLDESLGVEGNVVYQGARSPAVDGVVAATSTLINELGAEPGRRILRSLGVPCVSVGLRVEGVPSVGVDNRAGLAKLCEHLVRDHGYRRFAMIGGPEQNDESQERIATCRQTLSAFGVELPEERVTAQGFMLRSGRDGVKELFDRRGLRASDLDVIVCASDLIAEGALGALTERGVRVPDDLALTGFDDLDSAHYLIPPLSTVRQPLIDLGEAAARTLLQSLDGAAVPAAETLPSAAVVRSSCGCVSGPVRAVTSAPLGTARAPRALDGSLQLLRRRDAICAALSRAAEGQFAGESGWESRWVMALFSDLGDRRERGFLSLMEPLLRRLAERREDLERCQELLGVLRDEALSGLEDAAASRRLEDLLHSARLMTSGALERLEVNRRLCTTSVLYGTLHAVDRLMRAVGQGDFWEQLEAELRGLEINTCFITRYTGADRAKSSLLFGFSDVEPLVSELLGREFPSPQLLPGDLLRRPRPFAMLVRSLVSGQRVLGTLFLSLTAQDIASYEPFASLVALELARGGSLPKRSA